MAATVSPWAKPGAWALDSEEHEDELLHQQNEKEATPLADFPSLSAAATTKPKKKKGQTFSLADFTTYAAPKPPSHTTEPIGLTHQDRLVLPTGPRERTAEELERNGLGNGFRSYGLSGYDRGNRNGDDSSNSKWGSRGSDRSGRESNRESAPSRADEIDNWAAAKKPVMGNGFDRKERRGFFDSQSKADESDSWVSNKSYVPSEGRRFSGNGFEREKSFDRERRGFPSNGGGADSDNWGKKREDLDNWPKKREDSDSWGKKKEESIGGIGNEGARPRLNLQPRTLPASNGSSPGSGTAAKPKGSNPFGEARPREEVLAEKGQDWKKIDEQLESLKIKEANEKADGFGKRSFGNGHPSERAERSWRKPEAADTGSQSEEKVENEQVEAEAEAEES